MRTKRAVKVEYTYDSVVLKATKDAEIDDKGRIVLDLDQVSYLIKDLADNIGMFPR